MPLFVLVLAILCALMPGKAEAEPKLSRQIAVDAGRFDPEKTEFALINVGASDDEPWMVGGHLVLVARSDLGEYAFDWGIFDSDKPNFLLNYMRGILEYEHIVRPFGRFLRGIKSDHRAVTLRQLRLSTEQKKKVMAALVVWGKPENVTYAYDVVAKNCATVIRDVLFEALGANFREDLQQSAGMSARDAGRLAFGHAPLVYLLGEAAFGSRIDVLRSKWDLVYLPMTFPRMLQDLPAYDDSGARIPATKLLMEPQTVLEGESLDVSRQHWTLWCGIGLFVLIAILVAAKMRRTFRVLAVGGGVLFGVVSVVLILMWTATQHTMTHENFNLGFYWPVDILLVTFGIERFRRLSLGLAAAHLGVGLFFVLMWAVGVVRQDLGETAAFVLPLWAGVFYFSLRTPFKTCPV